MRVNHLEWKALRGATWPRYLPRPDASMNALTALRTAAELYDLFEATYLGCGGTVELKDWQVSSDDTTEITVTVNGIARTSTHRGVGPVEALAQAGQLGGHSTPPPRLGRRDRAGDFRRWPIFGGFDRLRGGNRRSRLRHGHRRNLRLDV